MICTNPYTASENATLAAAYAKGGIKAAMAALPNRSASSIYHRAKRLGVQRRRRWAREDDARLRGMWGWESIRTIARSLNRTVYTTYWRAQKLGLQLGCPEGLEYITQAAERCGYKSSQLERILRWAGVRILPAYSRHRAKVGHRMHVVEPLDVDDAMARWHATETVQAAARRHGVSGETLAKWLATAGVTMTRVPPEPHRKRSQDSNKLHRRVESAVVDRVVAERRAAMSKTETLTEAAKRIGVTRPVLARWMREAGHDRPGYHWRVEPSVVDLVASERRKRSTCRARRAA